MSIEHIFFDLDRTLWDFNANSRLELHSIWEDFKLHQSGISLSDEFIKIYEQINSECWTLYRKKEITKETLRVKRFEDTLSYFGIENKLLAEQIATRYTDNSPKRTILVEGALPLLEYLQAKYTLHIITNGFEEVQRKKLRNCQLSPYFKTFTSSEEAGVTKPHPSIFSTALGKSKAKKENSVYIGDDFIVDIQGASDFGISAIFYNPNKKEHSKEILGDVEKLEEIKTIL